MWFFFPSQSSFIFKREFLCVVVPLVILRRWRFFSQLFCFVLFSLSPQLLREGLSVGCENGAGAPSFVLWQRGAGAALQMGTSWYLLVSSFLCYSIWLTLKKILFFKITVRATVDTSEWCNEKGFPFLPADASGDAALMCFRRVRIWRNFCFRFTGKPVRCAELFSPFACTEAGLYR